MKTNLDKIKVMLALYGADINELDFSRPGTLCRTLRHEYKYDRIPEQAMIYAEKRGLLAYPGYNRYEIAPLKGWK